ncbi:hypothetical protein V8E36_005395 [Tilletia maclaganii]
MATTASIDQRQSGRGSGQFAMTRQALPIAILLLLSLAISVAQAASCGPNNLCPKSSPCCSEHGDCGSGAQQCAGGCQAQWSFQPTSCQPNPICRNLNITFKPSDYNNPDVFMPILAYDGTGSGNGGPPFTLDAGNLGKGPEGVLLQMTIGSQAKISSTDYFLYGNVEVTMRHNARQGLVAAFILMSDVSDEVDWEFTTADGSTGFTNYFSLGQYVSGHGTDVEMPSNGDVSSWHTFGLNWTPRQLQWTIDGSVVRTLTKSQAGDQFPRTPARVQLSTWAGGNATSPQGTQEWAGGLIDWTTQEYNSNGYYSQELQSYSITCADPTSSDGSSGSRRAPSNYTSWTYTGQNVSSTLPAFQLSSAPISAIEDPSADGSPAAPGASGLSKTSITDSWNGSGVKAKSGGGGGSSGGNLFNGSSALKYGVPIAAGIVGLILIWAACLWMVRRRRRSNVGKNNPLGAPGTAITGSQGLVHNVPGGGVTGGVGAAFAGKRTSKYAPLDAADMDDAPMGAQRHGTGYGPAVGPRPGPMAGVGGGPRPGGPIQPGMGAGRGGQAYEMGGPAYAPSPIGNGAYGHPHPYQPSTYGAQQSGYFHSPQAPRVGGGGGYGASAHHAQYSSGGGYGGQQYQQPNYRDY